MLGTEKTGNLQNGIVGILLTILGVFLTYGLLDTFGVFGSYEVPDTFAPYGAMPVFQTAALVYTSFILGTVVDGHSRAQPPARDRGRDRTGP